MRSRTSILFRTVCFAVLFRPLCGLATTTKVDIVDFGFQPAKVTIKVGDTVTWTNTGSFTHTTTSGTTTGGVRHPDGLWDSGSLLPGHTFSYTFTKAGAFPYYCTPHFTSMVGTVTVEAAANVPPTVSIASPADGATFTSPASLTIQATAADTDGTVAKVEFFDDKSSLGSVAPGPYTETVTLYPGVHPLTAVATDNQGAATTSATVTVTVNTVPIADPLPHRIVKGDITIELQTIVDGLSAPLGLAVPDDGSGRMFVYDQAGLAWVVTEGAGKLPTPLLDVRSRLVPQGNYDERGLLGLATHPDFVKHPLIYTYTSEPINGPADFVSVMPAGITNNHQSVIAEWRMDPAYPDQVDPASRREILRIDKPQSNHNGGTLRFGPDGFLYISLGDGGRANDVADGHVPGGNAQSLQRIYGKLLRIDVNGNNSANGKYGIPKDNPFVGQNAVQEIYAYGLRNPYTYSFDHLTGELYVGDAGQNTVEEVDIIVKGGNYGWNVKEGSFWFDSVSANIGKVVTGPVRPVSPDLIDPIAEYDHGDGSVVVGGYVYRGNRVPCLHGRYVFGDWGSFTAPTARLFYLDPSFVIQELRIGLADRPTGFWLRGFGQDAIGELYVFGSTVLGPRGNTGQMFKIVAGLPVTYVQHNLVSDLPGLAARTDPLLGNPWGIASDPNGPFRIAVNHAGVAAPYDGNGLPASAVVMIAPPASGTSPAAPTGVVFNGTPDFLVGSGLPAHFIYATEDGTIVGWNSGAHTVRKADHSASGAVYKGLALGNSAGKNYLYAANFHTGQVEVFDANFSPATLPGSFSDPALPAGFAPFNIQNVGGQLYVTYALQDAAKHDDVSGSGNGYVNVFDTGGQLVKRFVSDGPLNSPWGVALAPAGFGGLGGALLIGNFGDGRINAFNPATGEWLDPLEDASGKAISIDGLWGLTFGNGKEGGDSHTLYFTAGIAGSGSVGDHGLFGSIAPVTTAIAGAQ